MSAVPSSAELTSPPAPIPPWSAKSQRREDDGNGHRDEATPLTATSHDHHVAGVNVTAVVSRHGHPSCDDDDVRLGCSTSAPPGVVAGASSIFDRFSCRRFRACYKQHPTLVIATCLIVFVIGGGLVVGFLTWRAVYNAEHPPALPPPWQRPPCDHPIYCTGELLDAVQSARLFPDDKTFVDMPMRVEPEVILATFYAEFPSPSDRQNASKLRSVLIDPYFDAAGADIAAPSNAPSDYNDARGFPDGGADGGEVIRDPLLKGFADAVYRKWPQLYRQFTLNRTSSTTYCAACVSSISVPHPFMVPGGRFREFYYWDSFWIVKGLLASGMLKTAKHMVDNLLHLLQVYGFVPNGARIYYLDRSQPPLLTAMVEEVYLEMKRQEQQLPKPPVTPGGAENAVTAETSDAFLRRAVSLLLMEYDGFWMTQRVVSFTVSTSSTPSPLPPPPGGAGPSSQGVVHRLNQFNVLASGPRPEGYTDDVATAAGAVNASERICAVDVYADLASGAESGWDFSSRWIRPTTTSPGGSVSYDLTRIRTRCIVPVDLNAMLLDAEMKIASWLNATGDSDNSARLNSAATRRRVTMMATMWNSSLGRFVDLDLCADDSNASSVGSTEVNHSSSSVGLTTTGLSNIPPQRNDDDDDDYRPSVLKSPQSQVDDGSFVFRNVSQRATESMWNAASLVALTIDSLLEEMTIVQQVAALTDVQRHIYPGGVPPTSVANTGQQWDFPDGWPPVQWFTHRALTKLGATEADILAFVQSWTASNYCGFLANVSGVTGNMFEKYSVINPGTSGKGGEYVPQAGFGWTNGVLLDFLKSHGSRLTAPAHC